MWATGYWQRISVLGLSQHAACIYNYYNQSMITWWIGSGLNVCYDAVLVQTLIHPFLSSIHHTTWKHFIHTPHHLETLHPYTTPPNPLLSQVAPQTPPTSLPVSLLAMTVWGGTSVYPTRTSASVLKHSPPQNNFAQSGQTTTGCDVSCDL